MALAPRLNDRGGRASANEGNIIDQGVVWEAFTRQAPKMLVSRMQDHIVETSDGALHMAINLGPERGLTLFTSIDNGASWDVTGHFDDFHTLGSSDLRLVEGEDELMIVYTNDTNGITTATLDYDEADASWTVEDTSVVVARGIDAETTNPTIIEGGQGRTLVAYNVSGEDGVRGVIAIETEDGHWLKIDGFDPTVTAGALRVLPTEDGFGGIYANENELFWVTFEDGAWVYEKIADQGPLGIYATHFSTTTVGNDIFLVTVSDDNRIQFLHYDAETKAWTDAATPSLALSDKATSVQMSADSHGNIYITYDDYDDGTLVVLKSEDEGTTWEQEAVLDVPGFFELAPVRWFETPEHFDDELYVAYQFYFPFLDGFKGPNGLYYFVVDTDPDSESAAPARTAAAGSEIHALADAHAVPEDLSLL
ncbi:hypothetical protein DLJ53_31855 [Acuticoccus sediminis]|uniref:Exo-alpha-sialidase n=1 Tax=Acuticoccus sediminis TaxID=2184697 RepID=A0A8B2ND68_9HYPH|nr:hypothetical protein [Acuticoccus sediminis]RAH96514.1 hypothetical protein DLJ53_31855 [Acuticoccus sediminis]